MSESVPSTQLFVAEPPAVYLVRPPLVVDCNVVSAALFAESQRDLAAAKMVGRTLHAPYLLDHEFLSVAMKKLRQGESSEEIAQVIADYDLQGIELHPTNVTEQHGLAVRYKLSAYDAAYLWLAAHLKAPLATFDEKLGRAAQTHLASLT